ncbi:MAG: histidine kinase dimerization/phospho-acceptor domain-containing protein [Eubacteriales bacterium]
MAVSGLKQAASAITSQKNDDTFFSVIDETARKNSLLIFLTDKNGEVLYNADEYSTLYDYTSHSNGGNPYLNGDNSLNWEKGAIRNLPYSHMELIRQLILSDKNSLGYTTDDGSAYVYGEKLGTCVLLTEENVIMCISMPLDSVEGTTKILRTQLLWVSLLSLSLAFILAYFLSHKFEKPIRSITEQAKNISEGNFHASTHMGFCTELDDLSDTLNKTAESLDRLEHSRQELLTNVSHDLRTPLTMIKGYAEMVREISWSDPKKRNQDLDIIIRESDRLTALVNEILEYSSMQSLHQIPTMTVFSLNTTVTNVIRQFDALCREQGFLIEQSVDPDILIKGNEMQIGRVIYNFIDNAINHTDSSQRLSVALRNLGEITRFEVKDYGQGIPEENIPYIWDRYYTSRNRKNKATVSGLGLSIAKEILTMHEARFGVRYDDGCIFWFEMDKYRDITENTDN